jgi:hypothetical protein
MRTHPIAAEDLLSRVPDDLRDRPFPLLAHGSLVVEELTSRVAHRSALHHWARTGIAGTRLRTITVGRTRYATRRWLVEFFAAVDEARRSGPAASASTMRPMDAPAAPPSAAVAAEAES